MICTRFDARAMLCLHFQKGHGTDTKGDVAMNHAKCSRRAAIGSLATGLSAGFSPESLLDLRWRQMKNFK